MNVKIAQIVHMIENTVKPVIVLQFMIEFTKFKYESTEQFAKGKYTDIYKDRIHLSERVNAFIKGLTGMFHVKGSDYKDAKIQIILTGLLHNIIRLENIKGAYYW